MAIEDIYNAVMEYDEDRVAELVQSEVDAGTDVQKILDKGMIAALDVIGEKFSQGTLFVPEMLMAARPSRPGSTSCARCSPTAEPNPRAPSSSER